ncbi:integrin beta-5-like [Amphiura filiformis]|uniref:integrin beta-5-like n=1 Tax=Amphiura filiformis TaxID=82378 RepID=UPI003B223851
MRIPRMRFNQHMCLILCVSSLLLLHLEPALCQNSSYCEGAPTCGECISLDPACAWCAQEGYSSSGAPRCNVLSNHTDAGCQDISNPEGSYTIIQEDPLGDAGSSPINKTVQVSPQIIDLTLRPGETQTITLNIRPAEDYPLDLYFVMDLSYSMSDDLKNLRTLGGVLARELLKLSSDVTMGFGSFVDKVTLPFIFSNQDLLKLVCDTCDPGFGFRNNLPLSANLDKFSEKLLSATYSSSNTAPEGGLDGIMQIAVCKEKIGWREGARHFLVYSSDSSFHVAGDASLGQIFSPNDGECHLDPTSNEYSKANQQDFPSIGHLNEKIALANIYPIFAVLDTVVPVYTKLSKLIKGSTVGVLAADSNNIVGIIKNQYKAITSRIELVDTAPDGITVYYTAHCGPGDTQPGVSLCTGLSLGDIVSFDLEITATACLDDVSTQSFTVKPVGFEETLTITVEVLCSCDCENKQVSGSDICEGNGALVCGECECNTGWFGKDCQCSGDTGSDDVSQCTGPDSVTVCSGRGECLCGQCQCFPRQDVEEIVSGPFCQCDNFSCDRFEGELCGGSQRGKCVCDEKTWTSKCQCKKGYTGNACQCPDTNDSCMASTGLICNGFGDCVCGVCQCDPEESFRGPSCEECGICVGDCGLYRECVLCKVFDEGRLSPDECDKCGMIITVEKTLVLYNNTLVCETLLPNNCTVKYFYETLSNGTVHVHVQKETECQRRGGAGVSAVNVAIGIIIAILLIGLLIVLLLRLYIWYLDKKEWAEFEKERSKAKWDTSTNPIYKPSTTKHTNPMYGKTVLMHVEKPEKGE